MKFFERATWSLALACLLASPAFAGDTDMPSSGNQEASPAAQGGQFSAAQLAEMQARVELANTIAENVAADAQAKGLADSWRMNLLSSLLNTPSASLRTVAATAGTLDQVHAQVLPAAPLPRDTASQAKSLGSPSDSLVYTPVTPCRFVDTRVMGGHLTSTPRTYDTFKGGSIYGGNDGCQINPASGVGAFAFAANITAVDPEGGAGFLSVRPRGSTQLTSFINWSQTGPAVAIANAGIITTSNAQGASNYDFEMYVAGASPSVTAQAIVDYFGYFAQAQSPQVQLQCQDASVNSHPIAAGQVDSVSASCSALGSGWSLTGGGCDTNSGNVYMLSSKTSDFDATGWTCRYANQGVSSALIAAYARCCAVPAH